MVSLRALAARGRLAGARGAALVLAFGLALGLALGARSAAAQDVIITASVDRDQPRANESFTYVLRAEGRVRGQPDIAPLLDAFDILSSSESTRIQIVNGRAEQIAEWVYQLMPREPGTATIPSIEVAGEFSNPVRVEVLPAGAESDVPDDIFLEVDVSPDEVYVQSQIIYTLRLFVGTMTGRATITPPQVASGDAIIERLGDDREYRATRNGRDFSVRERRYAIFPQRAGPLSIGPAVFEAMVIPDRALSRVQRYQSEPIDLDVHAPVPPPASHPRAAWLPARRLTIDERWSSDPFALVVGVPTTRTLTIEAAGLLETQLPELELARANGVRLYADRPELSRSVGGGGLVSQRIERYAVLPQSEGEVELPGVELPWFDVDDGQWRIASLPARMLEVGPGDLPAAAPPPAPVAAEPAAPNPAAPAAPPASSWWPVVSGVLAAGWGLTLLLWWRATHTPAGPAAAPAAPVRPTGRAAMRRVRDACTRNDAPAARTALLDWAADRFAEDPPRALGALARRLPERAAAAVLDLDAALYAPGGRTWDGAELAAALDERTASGSRRRGQAADPLLPLYR